MHNKNNLLPGVLLVMTIVFLTGWLYWIGFPIVDRHQLAAVTPSTNPHSHNLTFAGPGCIPEFEGRFSLYLPKKWYADINENHIRLQNYDASKLLFNHGAPLNMPENAIKIDIYLSQLEKDQTIERWLSQAVSQLNRTDVYSFGIYELSKMKALMWKHPYGKFLILAIQPHQETWIISASIWDPPASALAKVLDILDSLETPGICSTQSESAFAPSSALKSPSPLATVGILSYPYPPPTYEPPTSSYPYPEFPVEQAPLPSLAPTSLPISISTANIATKEQAKIRTLEHPIPGGDISVSFSDDLHGWLIAYSGPGNYRDTNTGNTSLYLTQDGGQYWEWLSDTDVTAPDFVSPGVGYARQEGGLVIISDGGLTWQDFPLPDELLANNWRLISFDFVSLERGWIVLGQDVPGSLYSGQKRIFRLYRTSDGGSSWKSAPLPCTQQYSNAPTLWERVVIHLVGEQDAWLVCSGNPVRYSLPESPRELYGWLYHSQDDGRTWKTVIQVSLWAMAHNRPHGITSSDIPSLSFLDEQHGWVGTGWFGIIQTNDGGQTWHDVALPWFNNTPFGDLHVFTPLHAMAVWGNSYHGVLAETWDGGENWQPIFPPTLPSRVQFFDELHGIGIGEYPWQINQFFHTQDGGYTWQPAGHVGKPSWRCFIPKSLRPTESRGDDCVASITSFDFVDEQTGWAIASGVEASLYITQDGGETWTLQPYVPANAYTISLVDKQVGFLADSRGTIYITRDGGQTFDLVSRNDQSPYGNVIDFLSPLQGAFAVGGTLYWAFDGGQSFTGFQFGDRIIDLELLPGDAIWLLSVEFTRTGRGDEVYLFFSPDQGQQWTQFNFGKDDPRTYPSFDFLDAQHGWLRTSDHLYATSDGGYTWEMLR